MKQLLIFFALIFMCAIGMISYDENLPNTNTRQPDTQGNLNTTYQSDSVTTKKYTFKTYSPITDHQKNHVKEKR